MFDDELRVNGIVDLEVATVWAAACNRAADLMKRVRDLDRACMDCIRNTPGHVWCAYRTQQRRTRELAYATMRPFRTAIAERTESERLQAWSMVRTENVVLGMPNLEGNYCLDCERAAWYHITIFGGRTLCPFGREYYTYLNAWRQHHQQQHAGSVDGFVAMIARPKRRVITSDTSA